MCYDIDVMIFFRGRFWLIEHVSVHFMSWRYHLVDEAKVMGELEA